MNATQQRKPPTTIASWGRLIAQVLDNRDIDSVALFARAGLNLADASDPNARFSSRRMARVWALAVEASGDPAFALQLPQFFNPSTYNALGLSIISSRNASEAIHRVLRYHHIASDAVTMRLRESANRTVLIWEVPPENEPVAPEALEAFMATGITLFRSVIGPNLAPVEVHFSHNKSRAVERYQEFFRAPVYFGSAETKIVYDNSMGEVEYTSANPELASILDEWMGKYLSRLHADTTTSQVQVYLFEHLPDGEASQHDVAGHLKLSTRTLQRRLRKEGANFKDLLDKTRHDLALKYVLEPNLSLADVTYLLGFSDQSNFSRAFRRWTSLAPQQYRQEAASAGR